MTRRTSRELTAAAAFVALFAVLAAWAQRDIVPGDTRPFVWAWTHRIGGDGFRQSFQGLFATLGTRPVALVTVIVVALFLGRHIGRPAVVQYLVATAIVLPAEVLQRALGPTFIERFLIDPEPNFPSVHVVYATASWGFLAALAERRGHRDVALLLA